MNRKEIETAVFGLNREIARLRYQGVVMRARMSSTDTAASALSRVEVDWEATDKCQVDGVLGRVRSLVQGMVKGSAERLGVEISENKVLTGIVAGGEKPEGFEPTLRTGILTIEESAPRTVDGVARLLKDGFGGVVGLLGALEMVKPAVLMGGSFIYGMTCERLPDNEDGELVIRVRMSVAVLIDNKVLEESVVGGVEKIIGTSELPFAKLVREAAEAVKLAKDVAETGKPPVSEVSSSVRCLCCAALWKEIAYGGHKACKRPGLVHSETAEVRVPSFCCNSIDCPKCHVAYGEHHHYGCSEETCPFCFGKLVYCNCDLVEPPRPVEAKKTAPGKVFKCCGCGFGVGCESPGCTVLCVKNAEGRVFNRLESTMLKCDLCAVSLAGLHHVGCPREACPFCGGRVVDCPCKLDPEATKAPVSTAGFPAKGPYTVPEAPPVDTSALSETAKMYEKYRTDGIAVVVTDPRRLCATCGAADVKTGETCSACGKVNI